MLRREAAARPALLQPALKGLRAYQEAPRARAPDPMPAIAKAHGAALRDYGGQGKAVLFVPSLINPPSVLDLAPENSILRWLAARGHRVLLLDWGLDDEARRGLSVAGHVERILLPLLRGLADPPALAGYCLGGTMALAAAARTPVRALALIAAPWHFAGFPAESRAMLASLWKDAAPLAERLGLLPMEVLQAAFWSLDPERTVAKYAAFGEMDPASDKARGFVALEDWANDGPPLPLAAARELFEDLFAADLPGQGRWHIEGRAVDPAALVCPIFDIASTSDRIVPAASALNRGERIELALGHVGMMVGGRAQEALWEPLDAWLAQSRA